MTSGHLKSKKGTQLLFYMAIARHTTESVVNTIKLEGMGNFPAKSIPTLYSKLQNFAPSLLSLAPSVIVHLDHRRSLWMTG